MHFSERAMVLEVFHPIRACIDDSHGTLSIRFAESRKPKIKNGSQLIVRESQVARLITRVHACSLRADELIFAV